VILSHIIPFFDKKNKLAGFDFPFSLKPIKVKLTWGFSKTNLLKSVAV
jgi:hypothetical protein